MIKNRNKINHIHYIIDCAGVGDEDVVDELENSSCFGFAVGVVVAAVVAVFVGNSDLASAEFVIGDDIKDYDCDCIDVVIFIVERISSFSFYIICII